MRITFPLNIVFSVICSFIIFLFSVLSLSVYYFPSQGSIFENSTIEIKEAGM